MARRRHQVAPAPGSRQDRRRGPRRGRRQKATSFAMRAKEAAHLWAAVEERFAASADTAEAEAFVASHAWEAASPAVQERAVALVADPISAYQALSRKGEQEWLSDLPEEVRAWVCAGGEAPAPSGDLRAFMRERGTGPSGQRRWISLEDWVVAPRGFTTVTRDYVTVAVADARRAVVRKAAEAAEAAIREAAEAAGAAEAAAHRAQEAVGAAEAAQAAEAAARKAAEAAKAAGAAEAAARRAARAATSKTAEVVEAVARKAAESAKAAGAAEAAARRAARAAARKAAEVVEAEDALRDAERQAIEDAIILSYEGV